MENTDKKCSKCGEVKSLGGFSKGQCKCKLCAKQYQRENKERLAEYHKQYYVSRKEEWAEKGRQYYLDNKESILERDKRHYASNKDKILERNMQYYTSNKKKINEKSRQYHAANKEQCYAKNKQWCASNRETCLESQRRYNSKLRATPQGKLNSCISGAIWRSLRGNKGGRHWEELVGYLLEDLKKHLEKRFQPGMTWENYGTWHVDHRIPLIAHCFETPEDIDFKRAWSLKNLQPMWAMDNIIKGARIDKPFQPALRITA